LRGSDHQITQSAFENDHPGYGPFIVPELVESAARTEDTALLSSALTWISDRTRATATDWSLGIESRIHALLSDGADADGFYEQSIEHLRRTRVRTELARAHLLYGEWLRRRQRRVDAREQLSAALDMFETMGMAAFAARARRELSATGATVRRRTAETRGSLTPQEHQIAQLARDGCRILKSAHTCSSVRAQLSGTCARCSGSSASARGRNYKDRDALVLPQVTP